VRSDRKNNKASIIAITLVDDSQFHLKGTFPGPEGTHTLAGHTTYDVVRLLFSPLLLVS
jgi:hypothetical protein